LVTPLKVAVIVTVVVLVTFLCPIVKVADVFPAGTVTLVGTPAALFELDRPTTAPPVGRMPEKVTVPVTFVVALPTTVLG